MAGFPAGPGAGYFPPKPRQTEAQRRAAEVRQAGRAGPQTLAQLLRGEGFHVWKTATKRLDAAMRTYISGGDPGRFNAIWMKRSAGAGKKPTVSKPLPAPAGGRPTGGGSMLPGGVDVAGAGATPGATGFDIGMPGYTSLDPSQFGAAQAALAFNPQINALLARQAQLPAEEAQHLADISSWYNQVGAAAEQGVERGRAGGEQAVSNVGALAKELIAAAGGNEAAAGLVGAQAVSSAGTLAGLAEADVNALSQLGTYTGLEKAGAKRDERRIQQRLAQEIALNLAQTRGQKGAYQAQQQFEGTKYGNELAQQEFANQLALQNAQTAAALAGPQQAVAEAQAATAQYEAETKRLTLAQYKQQAAAGGKTAFNQLAPKDRPALLEGAFITTIGKTFNPKTAKLDQVVSQMMQNLRSSGLRVGPGTGADEARYQLVSLLKAKYPKWYAEQKKRGARLAVI